MFAIAGPPLTAAPRHMSGPAGRTYGTPQGAAADRYFWIGNLFFEADYSIGPKHVRFAFGPVPTPSEPIIEAQCRMVLFYGLGFWTGSSAQCLAGPKIINCSLYFSDIGQNTEGVSGVHWIVSVMQLFVL